MKILLITTGGTICSSSSADNGKNDINTEDVLPKLLDNVRQSLKSYKHIDFEIASPINTLSENMTVHLWNVLLDYLRSVDYDSFDGVIILHGTDTLHMTAPLLSILMRGISCPVILVSGNRVITDPESNAFDNLRDAVRMIRKLSDLSAGADEQSAGDEEQYANTEDIINVYSVYRNMDGVSYVHKASELEECGDYSEDFFSRGMVETEAWLESAISVDGVESVGNEALHEPADSNKQLKSPLLFNRFELMDNVLYIKPYVGINYDRYNLEGVSAVLHGLYHSSTANAGNDSGASSALHLLERCRSAGIPMYIFPCDENSYRYVTTKAVGKVRTHQIKRRENQ